MITFRPVPEDFKFLYSPVGLRLVDDLTGQAPIGRVDVSLQVLDGTIWRPVDRDAVITASGVVTYPGLGLSTNFNLPPQQFRLQLDSPLYRPLYRHTADGIPFLVPPYDHTHPPAGAIASTTAAVLLPGPQYPFAPFVAVLRGQVLDANNLPVPDVLVSEGMRERTLTDARGAFSLALRWVPNGAPTLITADDQRNGRNGSIQITLPAALTRSVFITV